LTEPAPRPPAAGLFRFSIEGRQAPALFVAGWLTTILGSVAGGVGLLSGPSLGSGLLLLVGLLLLSVGFVLLGGSQAIERRAAGAIYGGPSPILVFAATIPISLLLAALVGIVLEAAGLATDQPDPLGDLLSVGIQALVFIGVVNLMVVSTGALSWSDMGLRIPFRRALDALVGGAILAGPVVFVSGIVAAIAVPLIGATPPDPLPPTGTASGLALHLVAAAVIAPVAEEVLFRGAILTAWARTGGARRAIIQTAILFAAAHILPIGGETFGQAAGVATVAAVARIPVALALGWVYVRTGTLWAPIGLHATFNAILILISELAPGALGS
jgi:membrane protease YdiL (CAAX protease family)